ncbi:MAG: hypothetical protein K0R46_1262 [Herbinix sp.]|nr:hypothetical protein [Herbinix sp.]
MYINIAYGNSIIDHFFIIDITNVREINMKALLYEGIKNVQMAKVEDPKLKP